MAFLKCLKNGVSPAHRAQVMAGMYLDCKGKLPTAFGNQLVSAAYGKIWIDSIPQTGNVVGGVAASTGGKRFRAVFLFR